MLHITQDRQLTSSNIKKADEALRISRETSKLFDWITELDSLLEWRNLKRLKADWSELFDKGISPSEAIEIGEKKGMTSKIN